MRERPDTALALQARAYLSGGGAPSVLSTVTCHRPRPSARAAARPGTGAPRRVGGRLGAPVRQPEGRGRDQGLGGVADVAGPRRHLSTGGAPARLESAAARRAAGAPRVCTSRPAPCEARPAALAMGDGDMAYQLDAWARRHARRDQRPCSERRRARRRRGARTRIGLPPPSQRQLRGRSKAKGAARRWSSPPPSEPSRSRALTLSLPITGRQRRAGAGIPLHAVTM